MFFFWSFVIPIAIGLLGVVFRGQIQSLVMDDEVQITNSEFAVTAVIIVLFATLVTTVWGPQAARAQAVKGYKEFWGGSVTHASPREIKCTRDGPCRWEYDCDPYNHVHVDHHTHGSGDSEYQETHYEDHTHWHDCPFTTKEYSYYLVDNLGQTRPIAEHIFSEDPQEWRPGNGIPGHVARGVPERWLQAKRQLANGDAPSVLLINTYENILLPSEGNLLKQFSDSVDNYRQAGLMPKHTANLDGEVLFDYGMQARKIQFVGVKSDDKDIWQDRLMRFNAGLGSGKVNGRNLHGDLHIVVVPASRISNPDDYINALVAYWQNELGKWGFPKNAIALAIGVNDDASEIEWSRLKTGMPIGNGELMSAVSFRLKDMPFDADLVLGSVTGSPVVEGGERKVRYSFKNSGVLGQIMFKDFPFKRACMKCEDEEDEGTGFVYLMDSIPVSTGAKVWMTVVALFISLVSWGVVLFSNPAGYIATLVRDMRTSSSDNW